MSSPLADDVPKEKNEQKTSVCSRLFCLSFIVEYLIHQLHEHLALRGVQIGLCILRIGVHQVDLIRSISPVVKDARATAFASPRRLS